MSSPVMMKSLPEPPRIRLMLRPLPAVDDVVAVAALYGVVAAGVRDDVVAGAAQDRVVAVTALEPVVAGIAVERCRRRCWR